MACIDFSIITPEVDLSIYISRMEVLLKVTLAFLLYPLDATMMARAIGELLINLATPPNYKMCGLRDIWADDGDLLSDTLLTPTTSISQQIGPVKTGPKSLPDSSLNLKELNPQKAPMKTNSYAGHATKYYPRQRIQYTPASCSHAPGLEEERLPM
ncbi:hypothetical protein K457DRAFT_12411 [Linnemannia elongata AG-77]|uniref:Uncharacterized protein n=1 Tax=Linnemannia elongata AG-77 TaxID=1314771 RepID=A0A197KGA3_9FUNG|nr:hypothetical protein K457DRAFT_12411 [Linnemannia elongata AG-77]